MFAVVGLFRKQGKKRGIVSERQESKASGECGGRICERMWGGGMEQAGRYTDYRQCTDDELIDRLRRGEEPVMDYICDKYKNLVRSKAKSMFILGADGEDLIQEGMIGLFKAVRDYDMGRDASFYTFAELCISRQMYTAVQASKRRKHLPLNTYVSLDCGGVAQDDEGKEGRTLGELLADRAELSPEELFLDKERAASLERAIEAELSDFERQVLELSMTGMGYVQIAKVLGRDEKATDNALQRAKTKARRVLREG